MSNVSEKVLREQSRPTKDSLWRTLLAPTGSASHPGGILVPLAPQMGGGDHKRAQVCSPDAAFTSVHYILRARESWPGPLTEAS